MEIHVKLEYFNTSSSKCLMDMLKRVEASKCDAEVYWYYEEEDEDMEEAGEDYAAIIQLPFKLVETSETTESGLKQQHAHTAAAIAMSASTLNASVLIVALRVSCGHEHGAVQRLGPASKRWMGPDFEPRSPLQNPFLAVVLEHPRPKLVVVVIAFKETKSPSFAKPRASLRALNAAL